jgi:hypothetical protein
MENIEKTVLDALVTGIDPFTFLRGTFSYLDRNYSDLNNVFMSLEGLKMIDDTRLPSQLGIAISASGLRPRDGALVYEDLKRAKNGISLANSLHLCYLCTPITIPVYPNWQLYEQVSSMPSMF